MQLKNECLPAFIYFIIAIISVTIMLTVTLVKGNHAFSGFLRFILNLLIIFICTWFVTLGCNVHAILGWIIVIVLYTSNFLVYYL